MPTISPFAHPFYIFAKPVGASCNMACDYCYYLEKSALYQHTIRHFISDALLEKFIKEYIQSQTTSEVLFTWHGGEPLLRPVSFYEKVIELQRRYAKGRAVDNVIQTNGTLLNDQWCELFAHNGWLVGLSIDGPQPFHDEYRRMRNMEPTFAKVMEGIRLLNKHGVQWNAMAVVNDYNGAHPLEFYHFFKSIHCQYIQFTPIVERQMPHPDGRTLAAVDEGDETNELTPYSINPQQWGKFLCTIFDEWVRHDVGTYYIQLFDATLANWCGVAPGICSLAKTCGHAAVMEYNGDVYSCDHFVFPQYRLGNLLEQGFPEMMYGERQRRFGLSKFDSLPQQCKQCQWLFACHGECPKNRFSKTSDGECGLNYLCEGYHQFFTHVAPYMNFMRNEYLNDRAPANVMDFINQNPVQV
ncbi:MAG: anaerobic sulfatase-maturation protein [Prevotella sp.]|nr:anaerobic sulfatase-maturation protein [Prevotella sp.]